VFLQLGGAAPGTQTVLGVAVEKLSLH
jgi:hypothetical protein